MHETDPFSLNAYDYELPDELIAQKAVEPRDSSRLLVIDRARGSWVHRHFTDLPEYLDSSDLMVANNSRVIKARLLGHRLREEKGNWVPGGKTEFVLLEELGPRVWEGMFHAAAKHKPGVRFEVPTPDGKGLRGILIRGASGSSHGTVVAEFDRDPIECDAGVLPLPHYIDRPVASEDDERYQTVYAKVMGSAAAPTAGLHFTERVLQKLRQKNVGWAELTLHVGLGTFRPVKSDDIRGHHMHEERYEIDRVTADRLNRQLAEKKRILAVGTTSVRTLESAWNGHEIAAGRGRTSLFIHPGGERGFNVVNRLLTNFHLPRSTLLMLVSAFGGRELVMSAYREAVRERYRFFSYGDSMLIV